MFLALLLIDPRLADSRVSFSVTVHCDYERPYFKRSTPRLLTAENPCEYWLHKGDVASRSTRVIPLEPHVYVDTDDNEEHDWYHSLFQDT